MTDKKFCFVIGPIDEDGSTGRERADRFRDLLVMRTLQDQYVVKRADHDQRTNIIISQIIRDIEAADLIVADLYQHNPNVLYEVGIAHFLGKPIVMMLPSDEKPRFDISGIRLFSYSLKDRTSLAKARETLKRAADANQHAQAENPIIQVLGPRSYGAIRQRVTQLEKDAVDLPTQLQTQKESLERNYVHRYEAMEQRYSEVRVHLEQVNEKREHFEKTNAVLRAELSTSRNELADLKRQVEAYKAYDQFKDEPTNALHLSPTVNALVTDLNVLSATSPVLTKDERHHIVQYLFKRHGPALRQLAPRTQVRVAEEFVKSVASRRTDFVMLSETVLAKIPVPAPLRTGSK
jgi:hypothetical protein